MGVVMAARLTARDHERQALVRLANKVRAAGVTVEGDLHHTERGWIAAAKIALDADNEDEDDQT